MRIPIALIITAACCFAAERPLANVESAAEAYIKAVAAAAAAVPATAPVEANKLAYWQSLKRKAKQMQEGSLMMRAQFAQECMNQLYCYYGIEAPVITPQPRQLNPR